ncbi:MAG TPA: neutral zinc metallopeptidase [Chitinophagaceae bacterium]|nr:neutral zinc metallopeptidase [Chitinophagaceae bacterium]
MQWQGREESTNVDDRRGITGGHVAIGGGVIGLIFILAKFLLGGGDVNQLQQDLQQQAPQQQEMTADQKAADDREASFVKVVLKDTEDVWDKIFKNMGKTYTKPTLVLFRDATTSACGEAQSATGPFYCPEDHDVYIDLSFAQELRDRFNVAGDFAMAYVVAHEVGHHVQYLLGTTAKLQRIQQQVSETEYNKYSVKLELQADFYAGVWAHYDQQMKNVIDPNDIEQALTAANAIGDDRLQRESQGTVTPDTFTHGTSAQRMYWFKKGYETGDLSQGDTFDAKDL